MAPQPTDERSAQLCGQSQFLRPRITWLNSYADWSSAPVTNHGVARRLGKDLSGGVEVSHSNSESRGRQTFGQRFVYSPAGGWSSPVASRGTSQRRGHALVSGPAWCGIVD